MIRRLWKPITLLLVVVPLIAGAAATAQPASTQFAEAKMIVEVNATDGDAGLQFFLDGEPWKSVSIYAPDGTKMLDINTEGGKLEGYGLTELFSESSEPPFTEFPLEQFKALFPEGEYAFRGTTIGGVPLEGTATLSHDIPDGPVIVKPQDGARVPVDRALVQWQPVSEPSGIEIVGYQVLVTRENPHREFTVDLPAEATSVSIPAGFLEPGVEHKVEVLAIEASGNQTLSEITFRAKK